MRLLMVAIAVVSWWAGPVTAIAANPETVPMPALTDTSAYASACATPGPGEARCFLLARTDVAPRSAGQVSPAIGPSGLTPALLQSAYNLPSGSGGAGMTVAIVDAYDLPDAEAVLATYRAEFGLPACTSASGCFRKLDQNGGTSYPISGVSSGWASETALDLDMVSAVCPLCNILLVEADSPTMVNLGLAVLTAVYQGANAISNSYGTTGESVDEASADVYFNHPGVIVAAATGDCGYISHLSPCNVSSIQYPAASPWVLAVGGTSLVSAANSRGWTETAWARGGSGCSLYEPKPYWQTDAGCAKRTQADISAVSDPMTGVAVYDPNGPGGGGWEIYGGTSAATPIVASAYMLTGRPAPNSYPFRRLYSNPASLYDITSGSNGTCGGGYLCTAGAGYDGPTGLGTPAGTNALAPDVIAVGAGARNSCVLRVGGTLSCWGYNGNTESDAPAGTYVALSTSTDHSCAIDTARALHCWGATTNGMAAPPGGTYLSVGVGPNDSCAIDTAGSLHCWGDPTNSLTTPPAGVFASVTVGGHHACAVDLAGTVTCWGDSSNGKLTVPSGFYTIIAAGTNHTCGLRNSGNLICWGNNASGQTGGAAGGPWLDVASGAAGSCALDIHGIAHCWGDNSHGQNSPPGIVAGRIALGAGHGCLYGATNVTCWGLNADGQVQAVIGSTYLALTPNRLVDSRPGSSQTGLTAALKNGVPARFQVTNRVPGDPTRNVPAAATAVTGNLTVVGQTRAGYLSLTPAQPVGIPTTSTINVPYGDIRANGVTVPLGAGGVLWATFTAQSSATAHVVFDVTGYFIADSSGATYKTLTPNRLVDSRPGANQTGLTAALTAGTPAMFQVTDRVPGDPTKNVPGTATAVTGNLTVVGQTRAGYLSLTPARPVGIPTTSTLNVPYGDVRANGVTVPLGGGGVLWVTFTATSGTSNVVFDVTGYFVPDTSGAKYVPLAPNRLVDSRPGSFQTGLTTALTAGTPAMFQVTDRVPTDLTRNVPSNAVAITGNLTVVGQTTGGYLSLTPAAPVGLPSTSTLNFPYNDIRANGAAVPLGTGPSGGVQWVTFSVTAVAHTDVVFDVTGYFTL